jgi:hypothetical protein
MWGDIFNIFINNWLNIPWRHSLRFSIKPHRQKNDAYQH